MPNMLNTFENISRTTSNDSLLPFPWPDGLDRGPVVPRPRGVLLILFLDAVGGPWDGNTPTTKPIGGSELAQIQLAEALAARGHEVRVLNQAHFTGTAPYQVNGVIYGGGIDAREVRTVVLARMTALPPQIDMKRTKVIVSLTDQGPHDIADCHLIVGVSQWQVNRFATVQPGTPVKVIPPIVEAATKQDKVSGSYVYAGAAMKGLDDTLNGWSEAGKPGILFVATGGWGEPSEEQKERIYNLGGQYCGNLNPSELRNLISDCQYLLGAKTYPETFCAVAAIAETCGTVPILYSPHGRTGLDEAIVTPVFYSRDEWIENIRKPHNIPVPRTHKLFTGDRIARLWEKVL